MIAPTLRSREEVARRRLVVRDTEGRKIRDGPHEPRCHRDEHRDSHQRPTPDQSASDVRADVDKRRSCREDSRHEQSDRNRDLESGVLLGEQDALRPHGVEPEEAPRGHERQ